MAVAVQKYFCEGFLQIGRTLEVGEMRLDCRLARCARTIETIASAVGVQKCDSVSAFCKLAGL